MYITVLLKLKISLNSRQVAASFEARTCTGTSVGSQAWGRGEQRGCLLFLGPSPEPLLDQCPPRASDPEASVLSFPHDTQVRKDTLPFSLKKKKIFFKKQSCRGRRDRELFYLLTHSPSDHSGQNCAKPKPGAWNSIRVSCVPRAGAQELGPSSAAFQDI